MKRYLTAGALFGAPAKELRVLYRLRPLAEVLSLILSLGGNILLMESTDYELFSNNLSDYRSITARNKA